MYRAAPILSPLPLESQQFRNSLTNPSWITALVHWKNGKVATTDGPYAETKEQLGGIHILEARDLNHAIQLISQHPGMKYGLIEIRPVADLNEMMRESERRRRKDTSR